MREKKKWSHLHEKHVTATRWSDFWQKYVPVCVPEDATPGLRLKEDFSVQIAEGGRLFQLQGQSKTGFKGKAEARTGIKTFSRRSRWELQKAMAVIDEKKSGLPLFLTLTYPGEWAKDWRIWKRDLKVFNQAMSWKYREVWGPWRLEFQERGAPHFHSLLWDGPKIETMEVWDQQEGRMKTIAVPPSLSEVNKVIFEWFSETWFRIVGSGDKRHLMAGIRLEPIQSWNGVIFYASKYLAKLLDGNFTPVDYTGRFWGRIQPAKWKTCVWKTNLAEAEFYSVRRVLRKKREAWFREQNRKNQEKGLKRVKLPKNKYMEPGQGMTDIGLSEHMGCKLLMWAYNEMCNRGAENRHAPF